MVQIPAAKDVSLAAHNDSIINIVAICNVKQGKSHTSRATWSIVLGSHTTQRCGDVFLSVVYDDVSWFYGKPDSFLGHGHVLSSGRISGVDSALHKLTKIICPDLFSCRYQRVFPFAEEISASWFVMLTWPINFGIQHSPIALIRRSYTTRQEDAAPNSWKCFRASWLDPPLQSNPPVLVVRSQMLQTDYK